MKTWTIEFRAYIEALMAEAAITDEGGTMVEAFRVYRDNGDFVVRTLHGETVARAERWDYAARKTLALAHAWVERAFDAAPLPTGNAGP
jgi:hypothetical protein